MSFWWLCGMKKIILRKSKRLVAKVQWRRWQRHLAWKRWRKRQRQLQQSTALVARLQAPKYFNLSDAEVRRRVLDFLRSLRLAYAKQRVIVCLDFRRTEKLYSCATLLLVAELDRLRRLYPGVELRTRLPKDLVARQVLQQVGLLRLVGHRYSMSSDDFDKTVTNWRFATGYCTDASRIGEDVWDAIDGLVTPVLSRSIYKGITEAMTNSVHHAYVGPRGDGVPARGETEKRWWMFSQELDGHLSVVMCDLGVGIQRSLPREEGAQPGFLSLLEKYLSPFMRSQREAAMIKAAVEIGYTRTKLQNRGKGLRQIVDAIVAAGDTANMVIYSNCGAYWVESESSKKVAREKLIQYDGSIMGTLIQWKLPVTEQEV
ncbi:hypothetical protein B0T45_17015 [Chromobacterium haemolyticum]|uniref:ATP-binding protein n=2 Tax=Chromobacterium haemolyticum TaxID=394935 RepID=A0A1W0CM58_9NEIS|nr:hypothetical protein B0T45_17015 [Chromobacterium haemolyticum]